MTTQVQSAQPTAPIRGFVHRTRHPGDGVDQDLWPPGWGHVVVVADWFGGKKSEDEEAEGRRR